MNSEPVIIVQDLCKTYKLYEKSQHRLIEALHPFRKKFHHDFQALKNISFEIQRGECIGIIGKNGAGKSTLLKILTGVLIPTSGSIKVNGRIAALLELGSGFNPELSGLENIYFQGAIMGFKKNEMDMKLKEILEFAEVGEFIHQPVKSYSSGMFARLAFSISINVDPDVLIVDEALSVGDMRFQQKCIRKMREFGKQNRVIIFVSHDVSQIKSFCDRAIWINNSQVEEIGDARAVCDHYFSYMTYDSSLAKSANSDNKIDNTLSSQNIGPRWLPLDGFDSFGEGGATIMAYQSVLASTNREVSTVRPGDDLIIRLRIDVHKTLVSPGIGILIKDKLGTNVTGFNSYVNGDNLGEWINNTEKIVEIGFKFPPLLNGDYFLTVAVSDGTQHTHTQEHWVHDMLIIKTFQEELKYQIGNLLVLEKNVSISVADHI